MDPLDQQFSKILDQIPIGLILVRADFLLVGWNDCMEAWTGVPGSAVLNRPFRPGPLVQDAARLEDAVRHVLAHGKGEVLPTDSLGAPFPGTAGSGTGIFGVAVSPFQTEDRLHALITICALPEFADPPIITSPAERNTNLAVEPPHSDRSGIEARLQELGMAEDPELEAQILREFESTVSELSTELGAAVQNGDAVATVNSAHRLAGCALTMGAARLGEASGRIERDAEAIGLDQLGPAIQALDGEVSQIVEYCRQFRLGARTS